jgi:hypothetical protein
MTRDNEKQLSLDFSVAAATPSRDSRNHKLSATVIDFAKYVRSPIQETSLLEPSPAVLRLLQEAKRIPW